MTLLDIQKLKKTFVSPDGESHTVVDVEEFELAAKAQVALSGESGSGKTTFLNLIAGILSIFRGNFQPASNSGWRLRAHWPTVPGWCSRMSPPETWIIKMRANRC